MRGGLNPETGYGAQGRKMATAPFGMRGQVAAILEHWANGMKEIVPIPLWP